jgi:hypothetical protein
MRAERRLAPSRAMRRAVLVAAAVAFAGAVTGVTSALGILPRVGSHARESLMTPAPPMTPLPALRVFGRAQTAAEAAAAREGPVARIVDVLTTNDAAVPADLLPGAARKADLRVPLRHLGRYDRSVFVVRTAKGRICAGVTDFSAGCLAGFPSGEALTTEFGGGYAGEGAIVWGIARDDVSRVSVTAGGVGYPATLRGNVYFFQAPNGYEADALEAVTARLVDGTEIQTPIRAGPLHPPKQGAWR